MDVTLINVSDCEINYNWSPIYESCQGHLLSLRGFGFWLNGPSSWACFSHVKTTLSFVKCFNSVSGNIYLPVVSSQFDDRSVCLLRAGYEAELAFSTNWAVKTMFQLIMRKDTRVRINCILNMSHKYSQIVNVHLFLGITNRWNLLLVIQTPQPEAIFFNFL